MRTVKTSLFLLPTLITGLGSILAAPAQAQYSFDPQVQSTNTARISYNSGTGAFQYTDTNNLSTDYAGLILTGNAATLITTSNGWTASLMPNLSARSMSGNGPYVAMGLFLIINNNYANTVNISLKQVNYTGSGNNIYGPEALFEAVTNSQDLATTPLGNSRNLGGPSFQLLSGGTNDSKTTESVNGASGVVTLTGDALTDTLTGYFNGTPVGSISLASWGPNPALTLAVVGVSGYRVNVPAGTDTASNFYAGRLPVNAPQLTLIHSGVNIILTWPTNAGGFTLQSTTNLVSPAWTAVSPPPAPVEVNGQNTVTNPVSATQRFYRLSH